MFAPSTHLLVSGNIPVGATGGLIVVDEGNDKLTVLRRCTKYNKGNTPERSLDWCVSVAVVSDNCEAAWGPGFQYSFVTKDATCCIYRLNINKIPS